MKMHKATSLKYLMTECGLRIWTMSVYNPKPLTVQFQYRWTGITCKNCLRTHPKLSQRTHGQSLKR